MQIAICDDEQVICGQLEDLLLKIGNDLDIKWMLIHLIPRKIVL